MAMDFETVKKVREAQRSAQERFDAQHLLNEENINAVLATETANQLVIPKLTEVETMIFKMRTELIDYIIAHGLVDGLNWDGENRPTVNGKIVITKEMIDDICIRLGFQKEKIKIVDVWFNGISVLDESDRTAKIVITPEDIKTWYESNPDTNCFTDEEKVLLSTLPKTQEELAELTLRVEQNEKDIVTLKATDEELAKHITQAEEDIDALEERMTAAENDIDDLEKTKVDDVLINDVSTLDTSTGKVIAKITRQQVKQAYEDNPDTNAFDDAAMKKLASVEEGAQKNAVTDVLLDDDSVLDHERHAELTGELIKKSLEKTTAGNLDATVQSVTTQTQSGSIHITTPTNHNVTFNDGAPISKIRLGTDAEATYTVAEVDDGQVPEATAVITEDTVKAAFPNLIKDYSITATTQAGSQTVVTPQDNVFNFADGVPINGIMLGTSTVPTYITPDVEEGTIPQTLAVITEEHMKEAFPNLGGGSGLVDDVQVDGTSVVTDKVANITIPVKDVKLNGSSTVKDGIAELEIDTSAFNVHTIPLTTTLKGDITDVGEHDALQFNWLFQLKNQGMYQNVIPHGSNDAPNILYIPKAGTKGWSGGITELKNINYQDQGQALKFKAARYFLPYGLSNVEGTLQAELFTELYIVVPKQDDPAEPGSDDESTYYAIEDGYALTLTVTNCSKTIAYKRISQDDINTMWSDTSNDYILQWKPTGNTTLNVDSGALAAVTIANVTQGIYTFALTTFTIEKGRTIEFRRSHYDNDRQIWTAKVSVDSSGINDSSGNHPIACTVDILLVMNSATMGLITTAELVSWTPHDNGVSYGGSFPIYIARGSGAFYSELDSDKNPKGGLNISANCSLIKINKE